jgi:hypothetical protein
MRKLVIGVAAALALSAATPALAQVGFYAGPSGFDVELGPPAYYAYPPPPYYGYPYDYGYYDYWGPGWYPP